MGHVTCHIYESYVLGSTFNGDIGAWDMSSVKSMDFMFSGSLFNGDISGWDVSEVYSMAGMFMGNNVFTGNISGWDVSFVHDMTDMFRDSAFDGDISAWDVGMECRMPGMFVNSVLAAGMGRSYHKDPAGMKVLLLRSLMDGKPVEGTYGLLHAVADGMDTRIFNKDI